MCEGKLIKEEFYLWISKARASINCISSQISHYLVIYMNLIASRITRSDGKNHEFSLRCCIIIVKQKSIINIVRCGVKDKTRRNTLKNN